MTLYHGSDHIIEKPVFGHGKAQNDYGLGFYCTEHLELAKEWASGKLKDGFANAYEIDLKIEIDDILICDSACLKFFNDRQHQARFPAPPNTTNDLNKRELSLTQS